LSECTFRVIATEGSRENAELLTLGEDDPRKADLALIQSDVAYLKYFEKLRPYVALAALYTEPIHIVARRELGLKKVSELMTSKKGRGINVGTEESGTIYHALIVMDDLVQHRIGDAEEFEELNEPFGDALVRLEEGEIDIAFITSAVPVGDVEDAAEKEEVSLLEIDSDVAERLKKKNPFFSLAEIPYDAYEGMKRSIRTLGTKTLLVVRPGFSSPLVEQAPEESSVEQGSEESPVDPVVEAVLDSVYALASEVHQQLAVQKQEDTEDGYGSDGKGGDGSDQGVDFPFLDDLHPEVGLEGISVSLHPESEKYHQRHSKWYGHWFGRIRAYALPAIILLTPLLVLLRLSRVAHYVHQFVLGRVLLLLVAIWLFGSATMHLIEGPRNSAFHTFRGSAIAILHYLFSGLESKEPITMPGHIVAIAILSLGVAVVTLFTATLVTLLVERALNVKHMKLKPWRFIKLRGHVIIVGWSDRADRVVRQLRSSDLEQKPTIVIVTSDVTQTNVSQRDTFRNTWVVEGDPCARDTLVRADLETAMAAVVFSEESCSHRADLKAISSALAIESVAPRVRSIVEVQRTTNTEHLKYTKADEVVDSELLGDRLISQCVITPGLAAVYNELSSFGRDSEEIYWVPLPASADGMDFFAVQREMASVEMIPIGYQRREEGIILNPRSRSTVGSAPEALRSRRRGEEGDQLIVVADHRGALAKRLMRRSIRKGRFKRRSMMKNMITSRVHKKGAAAPARACVGICGWNPQAKAVIEQLTESVVSNHHKFDVTVIDVAGKYGFGSGDEESYEDVKFVMGDPTRRKLLKSAGIGDFDSLVILADRSDKASAKYTDHRSLMVALAANSIKPDLHIVVEVINSEHREHFERIPHTEIVSVQELSEKLLAQAVISPGITEVFFKLLTATADSNEIYVVSIPESWEGLEFQEVYREFLARDEPVIPLGYRCVSEEGGEPVVILNPHFKEGRTRGAVNWRRYKLQRGDALVAVAYEEPVF
jgi:voltage-gated potassium channel